MFRLPRALQGYRKGVYMCVHMYDKSLHCKAIALYTYIYNRLILVLIY